MNVIDFIGEKVGENRRGESDLDYAHRILSRLYETYQSVNTEGWTCERETNEYELRLGERGFAHVVRDRKNKRWAYYVNQNGVQVAEGTARYLEKAMQICSLALSP